MKRDMNYRPGASCENCRMAWSIRIYGAECPSCGEVPEGVSSRWK